jgi:hypothetical protein
MSNTNSDLILCCYEKKAVYICLKRNVKKVDPKEDENKTQEKNDETKNNMKGGEVITLPDAIAVAIEGSFFCF